MSKSDIQIALAFVTGYAGMFAWIHDWRYSSVALAILTAYSVVQAGVFHVLEFMAEARKEEAAKSEARPAGKFPDPAPKAVDVEVYRVSPQARPPQVAPYTDPLFKHTFFEGTPAKAQLDVIEWKTRQEFGTGRYNAIFTLYGTKTMIHCHTYTIE